MEDTYRLKVKLGNHEFEAEGPVAVVQAQFEAFKQMINTIPAAVPEAAPQSREQAAPSELPHLPLEKIMKVEGRVVSLTARSETVEEAVLLTLFGQKEFRSNEEVTGAEIQDGLKRSGYILPRIDRIMDKHSAEGSVMAMGVNRGKRYRLTNQGLTKALGIAREVIATVP